jgi:voltage-gated potassium channel
MLGELLRARVIYSAPMQAEERPAGGWRHRLHEIIFESDTPEGKAFDLALLAAIVLSVAAVCLESVPSFRARHGDWLRAAEWMFTVLFTVEYTARLVAVRAPLKYARSFFGVVDLLAVLPTYLSFFIPGTQSLLVVRILRLLRVFRILKLGHFLGEADVLLVALRGSRRKVTVFLVAVVGLVVIMGALMYLIEGPAHGYDSIPRAIYWATVTVTTVGFGDITPKTPLGQFVSSLLMIVGYGIIAVPTGIVSVELAQAGRKAQLVSTQACPACGREGHDHDAICCKYCGTRL